MSKVSLGWKRTWPPYAANFFYSLHYAATIYINSSFLGQFFSLRGITFLYVFGALLSLFFFHKLPRLISYLSLRKVFFLCLGLETLATLGLAFSNNPLLSAVSFCLYGGVSALVYYCLDISLETVSLDAKTGSIRGSYLTVSNLSIALAPLLVAVLATGISVRPIYLVALVLLLPLYLIGSSLPEKPALHTLQTSKVKTELANRRDLRRITLTRGSLEFFYALMTIFLPVYLFANLNFSWAEIGVMFSIMLSAFVIFEWLAGIIADHLKKERAIMMIGEGLMIGSVLIMAFAGHDFWLWTLLLFISRIGASLMEITCESYFFKQVDAQNTKAISSYRMMRPGAVALGAMVGWITLALLPFPYLFFVLALSLLFGFLQSLKLKEIV